VAAQIVWLDGAGAKLAEVGERAAALDRLTGLAPHGVLVPRTFVLGRSMLREFVVRARRDIAQHVPVRVPLEVVRDIAVAVKSLTGSVAVRRSPLEAAADGAEAHWLTTTMGGRPERETYLHLTDATEVSEAVRRVWGPASGGREPPVAIMVQRFMVPEVCAAVRRDRTDAELLHIMSSLGTGDLLASGLVVPDRHRLRRATGEVLACSLGRKAQMTVPRPDGGLVRVPVPAQAARQLAVDDDKLRELYATWRSAEEALPGLAAMGLSWSGGRWYVTSAVSRTPAVHDEIMLG
jgi:hypothetical protein